MNYLNPMILKSPLTKAEEALLEVKFQVFGTQWKRIAHFFPNRSASQIKNHWNMLQRRAQTEAAAEGDSIVKADARADSLGSFDFPEFTMELFPMESRLQNPWDGFF
jgi:hypothetical protein